MTEPTLFDLADADPGAAPQKCDLCPVTLTASLDGLRTRGWTAYDGTSFTGKALTVRICPACQA